jgi:hypothetical protein
MSYDPTKKYVWAPDEKIEINGFELATLVNTVRSVLNRPEAQAIIFADKANQILDKIMEENLNAGKIKEADQIKPLMKLSEDEEEEANA